MSGERSPGPRGIGRRERDKAVRDMRQGRVVRGLVLAVLNRLGMPGRLDGLGRLGMLGWPMSLFGSRGLFYNGAGRGPAARTSGGLGHLFSGGARAQPAPGS